MWKNKCYSAKCQLKSDWLTDTLVISIGMERREELKILVEGRGEVVIHYRYNEGLSGGNYEVNINAYDLARLLELTESPNLSQLGFKFAVRLSFNNAPERFGIIDLPEEVMTASPNRLREMAAENGDQ